MRARQIRILWCSLSGCLRRLKACTTIYLRTTAAMALSRAGSAGRLHLDFRPLQVLQERGPERPCPLSIYSSHLADGMLYSPRRPAACRDSSTAAGGWSCDLLQVSSSRRASESLRANLWCRLLACHCSLNGRTQVQFSARDSRALPFLNRVDFLSRLALRAYAAGGPLGASLESTKMERAPAHAGG
jgi:hypothetical protein